MFICHRMCRSFIFKQISVSTFLLALTFASLSLEPWLNNSYFPLKLCVSLMTFLAYLSTYHVWEILLHQTRRAVCG